MAEEIELHINGFRYEVVVEANATLLHVLRNKLGLYGTKMGCSEGKCGACTVLIDGQAYNSCLMLAVRARGKTIETVEGLAVNGNLHPLQASFIQNGAIQCGYCTPGMMMSAKALLEKKPTPSIGEIRIAISGNICRCTGYKKIIEAIQKVPEGMREQPNVP